MRSNKPLRLACLTGLALSIPGLAFAQSRLGPASVFADATPLIKVLMLALVIAAVAAVVLMGLKLSAARRLSGGSSYVSALRAGGPLIGLLGATFNLLWIFIGIANTGTEVPLAVLSPGFAEAAMVFFLGLFAGVVAVICHWVIEARIDRTVLSS